jgi:amidase
MFMRPQPHARTITESSTWLRRAFAGNLQDFRHEPRWALIYVGGVANGVAEPRREHTGGNRMNHSLLKPFAVSALLGFSVVLSACSDSRSGKDAGQLVCDADRYDVLGGVDLQTATVLDVQQALNRGAFTSEALVRHQLQLIESFDRSGSALNSIRAIAPNALEQARAADARRAAGQTRGPLDGVTVLLKDNIGTTDLPTTAGSIALATNFPLREATITRRLREAGAIVLGKSNLAEFANWVDLTMPNGYSSLGGQVLAPYNLAANPSGSSSGSAVAATMGFSTVTIGTETNGSIISPSAFQSLVGVKPTMGLASRIGIIPLAPSFDTAGPITRTVTDAAALLGVIAGIDSEDKASSRFQESSLHGAVPNYSAALSTDALQGVRLGVRAPDPAFVPHEAEIFDEARQILEQEGAMLVDVDLSDSDNAAVLLFGAIPNEFKLSLNRYLAEESGPDTFVETLTDIIEYNNQHPDKVKYGQGLLTVSNAQTGSEMDPIYLASSEAAIRSAQMSLDALLDAHDLDAFVGTAFSYSTPAAAGYPSVTVPMGFVGPEPQGLLFFGRPFDEERLLAYAYDFEHTLQARQAPPLINPELLSHCKP